jgi:hypothetical protein
MRHARNRRSVANLRHSAAGRKFILGAIALLACAWPSASAAQGIRPRPTAAECGEWSRNLAAGGARAHGALTYGWLAACPSGAATLGAAIRAARAERDTSYLFGLAVQAAQVRDRAVLDAGLEVAGDDRASDRARAASLLVVVAQLGAGWSYPGVSGAELLTKPVPDRGICGPGVGGGSFATENPLPQGHERRVARVLDGIAAGGGTPLLRNLARCSRSALGNGVPIQIDVSRVRATYVCGNTFRVRNNTSEFLVFGYSVEGSGDRGDLNVDAHKHRDFQVEDQGTLRLLYDGRVIATVPNERKPCR